MQKKSKIETVEGIVDWAGEHNWKSGKGWHYRVKLVSKRVDQVIQIDCYKMARQSAAGMVRSKAGWDHRPELAIQQGDRVRVRTPHYKREMDTNKNSQKYTRHIYSVNYTREIEVLERLEACLPPSAYANPSNQSGSAPKPA